MSRFLLAFVFLIAAPALAQDGLDIGASLPAADQSFTTTDGATLTLSAAQGRAGLTVLFWSDACPWVDKYADRVADLAEDYGRAGVGFVLVYPDAPEEDAEAVAIASAPAAIDADRALTAAFQARSTPEAFFFGPDGTLAYRGAIDDSPANPARVQVPYLQQAMDQSIAGMPIEVQSTRALGCTVKGR